MENDEPSGAGLNVAPGFAAFAASLPVGLVLVVANSVVYANPAAVRLVAAASMEQVLATPP